VAPSSVSVTISRGDVSYFLPGGLQHESVQDELGLTSAQKQKLLEIARSAAEEMQARQKAAWEKRRQMTPAEEIKFNREMSDRLGKQNEEVRKQVEQVLQPGQVERLKHIEFRQQAFAILKWTDVLNQFGPDQQQKEQLQSLRKAMYAEMRQLEDQNQDKVWGLLTAEQQEKAKDVGQRTILERMLWGDVTRCLAYNESVQNKLGLTPEQEQKFKEIAAKSRVLEVDLVKRLPTMKREEIRRSYVTSGEPIMRQVLEVFQPQQVERFKVWVLREWPFILFNPEVLDQIGLSEQQKEQIAKSRDELRAKLNQVQAAGEEKLLAVLTAQQVEKLKERLKK
jgi:Spy/CpxP family protein refolding chaperone